MIGRVSLVVAISLASLTCAYSRAVLQEATDPMATSVRKHFATQAEAEAALDRYVQAATALAQLTAQGTSHLDCLYEYFCTASGHDEEPIRSDPACYKSLRHLDDAALEAFGRYHSRWFGDVFGWVVYGDDGARANEEVKLARMHVIDEYAVDLFTRFWAENQGNPVAIAVIRGYSGERWSSCCRDELTYFAWADRMEPVFEQSALDHPDWQRLTIGCNGGRDASRYRLGADVPSNYGLQPPGDAPSMPASCSTRALRATVG